MNIQEFYNNFNGKAGVGTTAANTGECVGLVMSWIKFLGLPTFYGHAKDLYANAPDEYFAKISNTPDAIIQEGDIAVWEAGFNGNYGHTGIARGKADVNKFDCFEQNDPLGSKPHIKTYNYAYIIGWLRAKTTPLLSPIVPEWTDQTKIPIGGNYGEVELQQLRSMLIAKDNRIKELEGSTSSPEVPNSSDNPSGGQMVNLIKEFLMWIARFGKK